MIGLLATTSNPLTNYYLNALNANSLSSLGLIYDVKGISSRDIQIIHDRTGNFFQSESEPPTDFHANFAFIEYAPHLYSHLAQIIKSYEIKVLINIGSPRKLCMEIINAVPAGIINIHPGYLPYYRGSSAVEWSLIDGFPITNTIHYMSKEYDEGPVIATFKVQLSPSDNYFQIRQKVHLQSFEIFSKLVNKLLGNNFSQIDSLPQNDSVAKLHPPVDSVQIKYVKSLTAANSLSSRSKANFFSFLQ